MTNFRAARLGVGEMVTLPESKLISQMLQRDS